MRRRDFLGGVGVGALALGSGCGHVVLRPEDVPDADARDAGPGHDAALVAAPDAGLLADAGESAYAIATAFTVFLSDTSCSGHDHACAVEPGRFADDEPISFNGPGSHEVAFRPSELVLLEAGGMLPFATIGRGPGHGHCGLAWRMGVAPATRDRVDTCTVATPPGITPAVCEQHPGT